MVILHTGQLILKSKYDSRSLRIMDEAQISDDAESPFKDFQEEVKREEEKPNETISKTRPPKNIKTK